jgi:hypothetical protein
MPFMSTSNVCTMYMTHCAVGYKNCKSHISSAKNHFTHSSWIKQKDVIIKVVLDLWLEYQKLSRKDSDLGKGKAWVLLDSRDQILIVQSKSYICSNMNWSNLFCQNLTVMIVWV